MFAHLLGYVLELAYHLGVVTPKWGWLGHFLGGTGKAKPVPEALAQDWDCNLVLPLGKGQSQIRPYPSELFWLVGTMTVTVDESRVYGVDMYDFHPQHGQQVVHGTDKSLSWGWSGTETDPTQVPFGFLAPLLNALWPGCFRSRGRSLEISNEFWNRLGGKPFPTVLEVSR